MSVRWVSVVGIAAVLAGADWFWVVSLRGATGAVGRAQEPFAAWGHGAVLLTPVYVLAVLGALAVARRRWGDGPRGARPVVAGGLLVAVAATVVAVGIHAVSASYDFRLQAAHLDLMAHDGASCVGECVAARRDATLLLQLKAVGAGAAILLATNVVLVAWLVALQGGRLAPVRRRVGGPSLPWSDEVRLVLVAALVGAATLHAAVSLGDLATSPRAGLVQLVLALAALACARQAALHASPAVWVVAAGLAAVPLAWWAAGRGDLGLATGALGVLEVETLVAAVVLLCGPAWLVRSPAPGPTRRLAVVAVVAATAVGLGGSGLPSLDLTGVSDDAPPGRHQALHRPPR